MVTVIANQKRTIAGFDTPVPCRFDPIGGHLTEGGSASAWIADQPCVRRYMRFVYSLPMFWRFTELRLESYTEPTTTFYAPGTHEDGSGARYISVNFPDAEGGDVSVPVWGRDLSKIVATMEPGPGASDGTLVAYAEVADNFIYEVDSAIWGDTLMGGIEFVIDIAESGSYTITSDLAW